MILTHLSNAGTHASTLIRYQRRVIFAFVLVFLSDYPAGLQCLIIISLTLLLFSYQLYVRPFKSKARMYQEHFNELMILTAGYSFLLCTDWYLPSTNS
jgi:hypothetical protein